jgi:hypothetical protein
MSESTKPRKFRNDGRTAFIIVLACLLLIGGLRVAASGKASSKDQGTSAIPRPELGTNEQCETWASYWTVGSGVGASQQALEGMSNCRLAADGTWIVPTSSTDSRLANAPILNPEESAQTAALRASILQQIEDLQGQMPDSLNKKIATIYSADNNAVIGHLKDDQSIGDIRGRYTRLTQAYLMDPANTELADYVGWSTAKRQAAFADFVRSCRQEDLRYLWVACDGLGGSLSVNFPPWPWELTNSVNLDSYLKWAVENDKVPASVNPTTTPGVPA